MKTDIKLGYSCNNDCIHCVIADNRLKCDALGFNEDLTTGEYRNELRDSRDKGFNEVVFTGGEPTIRNDLPHLLLYAAQLGFSIDIQTNGRRMHSRRYAASLCSISDASFMIALHGHTALIHDAITRVYGSFNETVQAIANLVELSRKVVGKIVVSKLNAHCLAEVCHLYDILGVNEIMIAFPHALGNARRFFVHVVPRYSHTVESLREAIRYCIQHGVMIKTEAYPLCFMQGLERHVSELFYPDEPLLLKQLGSPENALDWSRARLENKTKFTQCARCRYDQICEGPWAEYPERFGSKEFVELPGKKIASRAELLGRFFPLSF
ncbi:MAG: radical SAM protein [Vulcanimicrobiota bacterium]